MTDLIVETTDVDADETGRAQFAHVEESGDVETVTTRTDEQVVQTEPPAPNGTPADDAETFPRDYVLKLRDENAKYRQRAADRDDLAAKLHTALVAATGRLADPSDLPFDDGHLSDPEALTAALDALLSAKPHLASRKPTGDIGQGVSPGSDTFSLSALLKTNAS